MPTFGLDWNLVKHNKQSEVLGMGLLIVEISVDFRRVCLAYLEFPKSILLKNGRCVFDSFCSLSRIFLVPDVGPMAVRGPMLLSWRHVMGSQDGSKAGYISCYPRCNVLFYKTPSRLIKENVWETQERYMAGYIQCRA